MDRNVLVAVWAGLNGALLAFALVFFVQSKFITSQVRHIVRAVTTPDMSTEQKALALLREAHAIVDFGLRHKDSTAPEIIQRLPVRSFDESILLPATGRGDPAGILFRLLKGAGIAARIGQMRCGDPDGCPRLVEGNIDGRWVVLDPLVGVAFRNENNELATLREVSANWPLFRQQVAPEFAEKYDFNGVQYTNWAKIPVSWFMAPNRLYFSLCLVGLFLVNAIGLALSRRQSMSTRTEQDAFPATASTSLPS